MSNFSSVKKLLGEAVLASLIIGFICISFIHILPAHADMDTHTSHDMSLGNCCEAGLSNHMELWKSTLVGIPQSFQDILALIVVGVAAAFAFSDFFATPRLNINALALRYRQYAREHPDVSIYNPLKLAFARGILHPKTY